MHARNLRTCSLVAGLAGLALVGADLLAAALHVVPMLTPQVATWAVGASLALTVLGANQGRSQTLATDRDAEAVGAAFTWGIEAGRQIATDVAAVELPIAAGAGTVVPFPPPTVRRSGAH